LGLSTLSGLDAVNGGVAGSDGVCDVLVAGGVGLCEEEVVVVVLVSCFTWTGCGVR
jgi:hypothetical protein